MQNKLLQKIKWATGVLSLGLLSFLPMSNLMAQQRNHRSDDEKTIVRERDLVVMPPENSPVLDGKNVQLAGIAVNIFGLNSKTLEFSEDKNSVKIFRSDNGVMFFYGEKYVLVAVVKGNKTEYFESNDVFGVRSESDCQIVTDEEIIQYLNNMMKKSSGQEADSQKNDYSIPKDASNKMGRVKYTFANGYLEILDYLDNQIKLREPIMYQDKAGYYYYGDGKKFRDLNQQNLRRGFLMESLGKDGIKAHVCVYLDLINRRRSGENLNFHEQDFMRAFLEKLHSFGLDIDKNNDVIDYDEKSGQTKNNSQINMQNKIMGF